MNKIVFVTQFSPSPIGHGGDHRAYQIIHDLCKAAGREQVIVLSLPAWLKSTAAHRPAAWLSRIAGYVRRRLCYYTENPMRCVRKAVFFSAGRVPPAFLQFYRQMLSEIGTPALVVIEHAAFAGIIDINLAQTIPTVACIANIESLEWVRIVQGKHWDTVVQMGDLAVEINILNRCSKRLFISKVEAGLVGGMGLSADYYPYVPVGEIRENLCRVRNERAKHVREPGLFLMLGSASHHTTHEVFSWFVQNAQTHGLPPGVRVVVAGAETDKLLPSGMTVPGLELRGWLDQKELDRLLLSARAVLVPQFRGFGALTRLPELVCAGIPVLVSKHPTHALDLPPGVQVIEDDWEAWSAAMIACASSESMSELDWQAYVRWEQTQPKTLITMLTQYQLWKHK